jgi:hypothetical protein
MEGSVIDHGVATAMGFLLLVICTPLRIALKSNGSPCAQGTASMTGKPCNQRLAGALTFADKI